MKTLFLLLCLVCGSALADSITNSQGFYVITNPVPPVNLAWNYTSGFRGTFTLYYGPASRNYTNKIPSITTTNYGLVLPQQRPATYFLAVTAVDTNNLESGFSNEISVSAANPPSFPSLQPPSTLIVQHSPTGPTGPYSDTQMAWSFAPVSSNDFFRVRLVATTGPMPNLKVLSPPPLPTK